MYTKETGIKDYYDRYKEDNKKNEKDCVDYKTFTKILKEANLLIRDKIVLEAERVDLPYNIGTLGIVKFENNFNPEKKGKWKIDFKKTKELGHTVYYGSEYGYRWWWFSGRLKGKKGYHFRPVRKASRMIAEAVNKHNIDYRENDKWIHFR